MLSKIAIISESKQKNYNTENLELLALRADSEQLKNIHIVWILSQDIAFRS